MASSVGGGLKTKDDRRGLEIVVAFTSDGGRRRGDAGAGRDIRRSQLLLAPPTRFAWQLVPIGQLSVAASSVEAAAVADRGASSLHLRP